MSERNPLSIDILVQEGNYSILYSLLNQMLERNYFNQTLSLSNIPEKKIADPSLEWLHLFRLPIHPSKSEDYDLTSRWQNVLGALHLWGHRMVFLLLRSGGQTHIYLGLSNLSGRDSSDRAVLQAEQALRAQMPGIGLSPLSQKETSLRINKIDKSFFKLEVAGAITGLPSLRKVMGGLPLQTLDQLSTGIRDFHGNETDYALIVVADPLTDENISEQIYTLKRLGSDIHQLVRLSIQEGRNESVTTTLGRTFNRDFVRLLTAGFLGGFSSKSSQESMSTSASRSLAVSGQYLDKVAEHFENVTDAYATRLQQGRNLGFWNTGIYVLAQNELTVRSVAGILRAIYSGDQSYFEPIRTHIFPKGSNAVDLIKRFRLLPFPVKAVSEEILEDDSNPWHILGESYQYISTPLNTEELVLATSLPRRDVPGLRFVRNAVRFAANPPELDKSADAITLGSVLEMGEPLNSEYRFDVHSLVRHCLVTGATGSGKTTTCHRLMSEVMQRKIPILIIEPAKDEYVQWAIAWNQEHEKYEQAQYPTFNIYMPGESEIYGQELHQLRINPFQPAEFNVDTGQTIDIESRCERFAAVLTASMPMADVLPLLLEEAIFEHIRQTVPDFGLGEVVALNRYPQLKGIITAATKIISNRGYEERIRQNLVAAVKTRIEALCRGKRGMVLNADRSTPYEELFERPVVVNLSRINDDRDKALLMALLLMSLYEYRSSRFQRDAEYRKSLNSDRLCHLTIVEEAHRLLANPKADTTGIGNPQGVVAGMFSEMLSEIRAYGQGLLIVDQVPSRLIPDSIKNTNLKIVHRQIARDDRSIMASCMSLRPDQEDVLGTLRKGEIVIRGDLDDAACWVKVKKEAGP